VTILSALSMMPGSPAWLAITGIIVAVVAMSKSFLGTYFGVIEGASEIVKTSLNQAGIRKSRAFNRAMSILLVSTLTFAVCFINPNAISMIYAISGPLIAMILFIMPTLSTYLIPALKPYRSVGNFITLVVGLLCVSVMFLANPLRRRLSPPPHVLPIFSPTSPCRFTLRVCTPVGSRHVQRKIIRKRFGIARFIVWVTGRCS
jgi:amino acid permease